MRNAIVVVFTVACACGGGSGSDADDANDADDAGPSGGDDGGGGGDDSGSSPPQFAELWYAADAQLVYVQLDADDGSLVGFTASAIEGGLPLGQNLVTMLDDGSLVLGRLGEDQQTSFYHVPTPPRDGSAVTPVSLGVMPDDLMLEGLYTDCDGRLYGMDTGAHVTDAEGNRLLRFTGDLVAGDFAYVVVSDLATASVADIDDMGPAIVDNAIVDNPGLAIDTGTVHAFDFETGSGTQVGAGGTYGIHALGGELFTDARARLYLLSDAAELFEMDPVSHEVSAALGTGPATSAGVPGWSGLGGPLTDCESGFDVE